MIWTITPELLQRAGPPVERARRFLARKEVEHTRQAILKKVGLIGQEVALV
jgi:hypothetical protein